MKRQDKKKYVKRRVKDFEIFAKKSKELNLLARMITFNCFRNTLLEDIHAGTAPYTATGDYSDVKVVTPLGEIPWKEVGKISQEEMKALMKEAVNKVFTFMLLKEALINPFHIDRRWDEASIDKEFKELYEQILCHEFEHGEGHQLIETVDGILQFPTFILKEMEE
jgi:hypothetical protein